MCQQPVWTDDQIREMLRILFLNTLRGAEIGVAINRSPGSVDVLLSSIYDLMYGTGVFNQTSMSGAIKHHMRDVANEMLRKLNITEV